MKYLLDTNTRIHCLRKKGSVLVKARFAANPPADIAISAVAAAELFHGAERSSNPPAELARVDAFIQPHPFLPLGEAVARADGTIRADLEARGLLIGPNDLFIAATALANDLTLVTHNTAEFARVGGSQLEDWELP